VSRAATLLGIAGPNYLTGAAVAELTASIRAKLNEHSVAASALPTSLAEAYRKLGLTADAAVPGRFATASGVATLVAEVLARHDNVALIETFASTPLPSTPEAAGRSLSTAASIINGLGAFDWSRLDPLLAAEQEPDVRGAEAKNALDRLRAALMTDELAQPLASALQRADHDAFAWLRSAVTPPAPPPSVIPPHVANATTPNGSGKRRLASRSDLPAVQAELGAFLDAHAGQAVIVEWRIET
jgi:hypothetical protein